MKSGFEVAPAAAAGELVRSAEGIYTMAKHLLFAICLTNFIGCSSTPDPAKKNQDDAEVANTIRTLVPEAASSPIKELEEMTSENIKDIKNQSLTMVLMNWQPSKLDEDKKLRDFQGLGNPTPVDLAGAIVKSKSKGYGTVIQPEYITDLTCQVKGEAATGVVSFKAEGLYQGRVEYTARRTGQSWRIEEFRLPGVKIRLSRNLDGTWQQSRLGENK